MKMRIAVGSDEKTALTDAVIKDLEQRGFEIELIGPLAGNPLPWPDVGEAVAVEVSSGRCDEGIVMCWTGTGVTIAANKVPGIRAALCWDAETARGARRWNQANVLALSLRATSGAILKEMLNVWFSTPPGGGEDEKLARKLSEIEKRYFRKK